MGGEVMVLSRSFVHGDNMASRGSDLSRSSKLKNSLRLVRDRS